MKKIAIITGASSGIGKEFALRLNTYDKFDEVNEENHHYFGLSVFCYDVVCAVVVDSCG